MFFKKRFRLASLVGAAMAGVLLVSGCASDSTKTEKSNDANNASSKLMPAAEGKTDYPLTLKTPYGTTKLKERPKRIAAVVPHGIDAEMMLAMGVTPVLSSSMVNEGGYLDKYHAKDLKTFKYVRGQDIPVEAVAASKPDLIVAVGWTPGFGDLQGTYDRLKKIAPVTTSIKTDEVMMPWQDSIRIIGKALDLSDKAEKVIDDHNKLFAKVRKEHPEFKGKTASWAIYYGPSTGIQYFSQPGSASEIFLHDLGFKTSPDAKAFAKENVVSDELISKIDADVLIMGQSAATTKAEMEKNVTGTKLFKELNAVKSDKFVQLPPKMEDGGDLLWGITSGGPLADEWAVKQLVPMLADKF